MSCCSRETVPVSGPDSAFRLRAAEAKDLALVRDLLQGAGLPADGLEDHFGPSYIVASSPKGIVGAAGLEVFSSYGLLRSVVVHPDWQGRGVGGAMVRNRIEWAQAQGLTSITLLTATASGYFSRFGFEPSERDRIPAPLQASRELTGACPRSAAVMERRAGPAELVESVRQRYADAARNVLAGGSAACGVLGEADSCNPVTSDLYLRSQAQEIPEEALRASLGCGNPTLLASLHAGEVVLDLGSGGGIDVLLSARRVGPQGKAYGLDMTDEMLDLARANQRRAGLANAEFLKGRIEDVPLPDGSVDVVISNCVLNLSTDKPRALGEAFRVLKPGGRLAISDIVVRGEVPESLRRSVELWVGCVAGALEESEYQRRLAEAGFDDIEIQPTRVYTADDARPYLEAAGLPVSLAAALDGRFMSAFIHAKRPIEPPQRMASSDATHDAPEGHPE